MMVSIVITTFNRARLVLRSINSALEFTATFPGAEIIVVDDASRDGTSDIIARELEAELCRGRVRYVRNPLNVGVTGSKNIGYGIAARKWVGFLDSDDMLLVAKAGECRWALENHSDVPIIFFRCVNNKGQVVGRGFATDRLLDLRTYVRHVSYGEAFTVVNKAKVQAEPYIAELRGCEGVGCARIIARHGPAVLSPVCVRYYDQRGSDRMSTLSGRLPRCSLFAKAHRVMLKEFGGEMSRWQRVSLAVKSNVYDVIGRAHMTISNLGVA